MDVERTTTPMNVDGGCSQLVSRYQFKNLNYHANRTDWYLI